MNPNSRPMTTAQFAKLHNVNKRTLHYYDSIGLFSPKEKGENGYRYYDSSQSIDFEYIRMFKELNMSIEEIRSYVNHPTPDDFLTIAKEKRKEIEMQIKQLKQTQKLLAAKQAQLETCKQADGTVQVVTCPKERYLTVPYTFEEDNIPDAFFQMKHAWGMEQCRAGIGSYLSVQKILDGDFSRYDGLFSPDTGIRQNRPKQLHAKEPDASQNAKGLLERPAGTYLCTYAKGTWDQLPRAYRHILCYAKEHHLELTGYAYEWGMNDFAAAREEDCVTRILVGVKKDSAR